MNGIRWLLVVPIALGLIAGTLFLLQGGFGGGHGDFDRAIGLLGLPAILVTPFLPAWPGDFLAMVLFPAIANFAVWFCVIHLFRRARTQHRT